MESTNDYTCTICQDIFKKPYLISTCNHSFCEECLLNYSKTQTICPICRIRFTKENIKQNQKLDQDISTSKTKCVCGVEISISDLSKHHLTCGEYKLNEEKAKKNLLNKEVMKETINRSTFACPVCKLANLERSALIDHILKKHPKAYAVCPICVCQPWGDPNKKTHLLGHMELRHKFDYDTYTDYDMEDDEILKQVLELSKNDK